MPTVVMVVTANCKFSFHLHLIIVYCWWTILIWPSEIHA